MSGLLTAEPILYKHFDLKKLETCGTGLFNSLPLSRHPIRCLTVSEFRNYTFLSNGFGFRMFQEHV